MEILTFVDFSTPIFYHLIIHHRIKKVIFSTFTRFYYYRCNIPVTHLDYGALECYHEIGRRLFIVFITNILPSNFAERGGAITASFCIIKMPQFPTAF